IAHAIIRYIRIGCELTDEADIEIALQKLGGTSIAHIEPDHNKTVGKSALSADQNDTNSKSELL
ncbi:2063_t:CDS:1, partial [Dentiscutata heterogama]